MLVKLKDGLLFMVRGRLFSSDVSFLKNSIDLLTLKGSVKLIVELFGVVASQSLSLFWKRWFERFWFFTKTL